MSNLFTITTDYDGGTYISQVRANEVLSVFKICEENLNDQHLNSWKLTRAEVKRAVHCKPIALEGLESARCATLTAKRGLILLNIIKTAPNH